MSDHQLISSALAFLVIEADEPNPQYAVDYVVRRIADAEAVANLHGARYLAASFAYLKDSDIERIPPECLERFVVSDDTIQRELLHNEISTGSSSVLSQHLRLWSRDRDEDDADALLLLARWLDYRRIELERDRKTYLRQELNRCLPDWMDDRWERAVYLHWVLMEVEAMSATELLPALRTLSSRYSKSTMKSWRSTRWIYDAIDRLNGVSED